MNRADLTKIYEQEKAKLNPAQREAVETIDGPVMVLAGPGTGKTQVLAFRIAEILLQTDIQPRNILALTFTESGVVAMRQRLASLIGVTAYGVGIYTFHSFANRVIAESGAEFYKSHTLDQIDDISQLKLVIQLLDTADGDALRPPRAPYYYVKPILSAIKSLKSEGVSPDNLRQLCQESIDALTNDASSTSKTGKTKGELKQSVKDKITRFERSIALASIYERYEKELSDKGWYDYEDMILFVLRSFQTNPDLKAKYQEQFQYILLDEYQDTNNAQNTLVQLLSDYFANPNLFVVGDDKQSIYRFQGASMANLLNFRLWYPDAKLISLQNNYRSGQPLLDNAYGLIGHNQEQLSNLIPGLHTELIAATQAGEVVFTPFLSEDQETLGVVQGIHALLAKGVSSSEIAIIYRENSEAEAFAQLLARQGIAFQLQSGDDVLKDNDIRQLMTLLQLAQHPQDETALFRYLHAPYSGVATTDLIILGRWCKDQRITWSQLLLGDEPSTTPALLSWTSLRDRYQKIAEWYRYQANHSLGETVEHVLVDSGLLAFIMAQDDHMVRLQRLRCFFDDVKRLASSVPFATLHDMFERLAIRQTYKLPLICPPTGERSDAAIKLMTAHKSKGLEFGYVFIPHFCDGRWSNGRKADVLSLPEGIVAHHKPSDEQAIEEDRRLFYVALTRGKQSVFISMAEFDGDNRKQIACQFLSELPKARVQSTPDLGQLPVSEFFSPVQAHFVTDTSRAYLAEIVAKQSLTPTGLNTYLTCPMEYLYRTIYSIPGIRDVNQAYGTAVHKALELWGKWSQEHAGASFSLASILSVFTEALMKEGLSEHDMNRFRALGEEVFAAYWEHVNQRWVTPLAVEYSFTPHSVILDGIVPITGKLDKIEPIERSKHVRVVDYKTGKVRSRNDIEGTTASSDGDYKRQLVFYAILAEADPFFPYTIGEMEIAFIDDNKKFTSERFEITPGEKKEVKDLIKAIYQEMRLLHFDHTPHKNRYGRGESLCDLLRATTNQTITPDKVPYAHPATTNS